MKKFALALALLFSAGSAPAEVMRDTFVGCKNAKDMSVSCGYWAMETGKPSENSQRRK